MDLPNFLGIGVQRAATTWLHENLGEHPDVFVPEAKELHFFNSRLERGLDWYAKHFARHAGQTAVGEITPLYFHQASLDKIADTLPGVRLLIIFRDPIQRAYSGYRLLEGKFFQGMSFREACQVPRGRAILNYSLYADKLERVFDVFPRERVLVRLYEDVKSTPQQVMRDVYAFLGVDPSFVPTGAATVRNHIVMPKAQQALGRMGLTWCVNLVKRTPAADWIKAYSRRRDASTYSSIDDEYFDELREFFRVDVEKLEQLIGRDLSQWKGVRQQDSFAGHAQAAN